MNLLLNIELPDDSEFARLYEAYQEAHKEMSDYLWRTKPLSAVPTIPEDKEVASGN